MRTIEFRAFDTVENRMLPPFTLKTLAEKNYTGFIVGDPLDGSGAAKYYKIENLVFMEYAGLRDHKDVKIFEGDFLLAYEKRWKVVYSQGCFVAFAPGRAMALRTMYCEVIGNVYENPRILR